METWHRNESEAPFTGLFGRSMETRLHYRTRLEALESFPHLTLPLVPLPVSSYEGGSPAPMKSDLAVIKILPAAWGNRSHCGRISELTAGCSGTNIVLFYG
jgi:hypothetical protein